MYGSEPPHRVELPSATRRSNLASRPKRKDLTAGNTPRGIAARAGVWSAQHRKIAIWGWLAFVVLAVLIGNAVGTKTLEPSEGSVGESGRADRTVADAAPEYAQELGPVPSRTATASAP